MAKWRRKSEEQRRKLDPDVIPVFGALAVALILFGLATMYFMSRPEQIPPRQSVYIKGR